MLHAIQLQVKEIRSGLVDPSSKLLFSHSVGKVRSAFDQGKRHWELVLLMQRLVIAVFAVWLRNFPVAQTLVTLALQAALLAATVRAAPYRTVIQQFEDD